MVVTDGGGCVFCSILSGASPAHLVHDGGDVVAFLDARPVFAGHTLVVLRPHVTSVLDLPAGAMGAVWAVATRVAAAQRRALGAGGTFFGLNDLVSQSVPHVHLHVVPRQRGDGLRGFFWPRRRYASDAEAAATAGSIRAAMDEESG